MIAALTIVLQAILLVIIAIVLLICLAAAGKWGLLRADRRDNPEGPLS